MPKRIPEESLTTVLRVVEGFPDGAGLSDIVELLAAWTAANLEHIRRCKRLVADHRGPLDRYLIGRIVARALNTHSGLGRLLLEVLAAALKPADLQVPQSAGGQNLATEADVRISGMNPSTIKLTVWPAGSAEPATMEGDYRELTSNWR